MPPARRSATWPTSSSTAIAPIATDQVNDEDPSQGIDPTKQALITIDNTVPTSSVDPLPATESSTSFTVSWSGSDGDGSGIAYYNVYVSDDGGAYRLFHDEHHGDLGDLHRPGRSHLRLHQHRDQQCRSQSSPRRALRPGDDHGHSPNVTPSPTAVPHIHVPEPHLRLPHPWPDVPTPPPVTVTGIRDVTNKKHQVTEVIVTFNGTVNATEADNPAIYRLTLPGKKGSYTAKNAKAIKLKSATYNPATDTVTIIPGKRFALTKPVQLVVMARPRRAFRTAWPVHQRRTERDCSTQPPRCHDHGCPAGERRGSNTPAAGFLPRTGCGR